MSSEILGLRTWRERKGVTLDAIAASTKLSLSQLGAIECGEFGRLPGGIYNTNYIRQYARAIEFDESELIDFYRSSFLGLAKPGPAELRAPSGTGRLQFQP